MATTLRWWHTAVMSLPVAGDGKPVAAVMKFDSDSPLPSRFPFNRQPHQADTPIFLLCFSSGRFICMVERRQNQTERERESREERGGGR
ncbi:hypothetical protein HanPI659440_Chr10g0380411 [Helianthus annuus]|nr:hypothetical protein HanPI659440_Chr10g0380411 [Helianthus annuus]